MSIAKIYEVYLMFVKYVLLYNLNLYLLHIR